MRKQLFAALMAAVSIVPAAAQAQDNDRAGRMAAREARQQQRAERQQPQMQQPQQAAPQRPDRGGMDRQGFRQERQGERAAFQAERQRDRQALEAGRVTREQYQADRRQDVTEYRRDLTRDRRQFNIPERDRAGRDDRPDRGNGQWANRRDDNRGRVDDRRWNDNRGNWQRPGNNGNWQRPGWNDGRGWNGNRSGWSRDWRNDRRYDWNRWRYSNRNLFRLPRYYAPYGWGYGYRRFSIGVVLPSLLFGQNYWIDDPWSYRLPEAYGPYRWVRYYNDAILVDVYSGQVVDVIYDIFW